jgi:hypothetical protein
MKRKASTGPQPPKVDLRIWKALFEAADRYVAAQPWRTMGDAEAFGVYDAESGRSGWCVALGQQGEHFGLGFYQELQGLQQLRRILTSKGKSFFDDFDNIATMNVLNYNWAPKNELDPYDLDILKQSGRHFKGAKMLHQFTSYRPGYSPWPLDGVEALFMIRGLEAGMLMAENLSFINLVPPGNLPLWKYENDRWILSVVEPEPWVPEPYGPVEPDDITMARIKAKTGPQHDVWEAGHFYQPGNVGDLDRPYHLHFMAVTDSETGFLFPLLPIQPIEKVPLGMMRAIAGAVDSANRRPTEVVFCDQRLLESLKPVLSGLNIKATFKSRLPALEEVKKGTGEYFSRKR